MSAETPSVNRFLSVVYPQMHMRLYQASAMSEEFRQDMPRIISGLIEDPEATRKKVVNMARQQSESIIAHALRIIALLSERGAVQILSQFREGVSREIMEGPVEAILLQLTESDRWRRKYDEPTFDLVLGLPDWSRVISVSTTDIEMPVDPIIPRLARVSLENVHLYIPFNRARGTRGRRIGSGSDNRTAVADLKEMQPFMRTCGDIAKIGGGLALTYFAPFIAGEGLRLGFFFAVLAEIEKVEWLPSPTGFGVTPDQSLLTFVDASGHLKARMNMPVFRESVANQGQVGNTLLRDPSELCGDHRRALVIGVWILGLSCPEVVSLGLEANDTELGMWGVSSFMNSHRKAPLGQVSRLFGEGSVSRACREAKCIVRDTDWLYYKEETWPLGVFKAMKGANFSEQPKFSEALRFGADSSTFKTGSNRILRFLRVNQHLLELYKSDRPLEVFDQRHGALPRSTQAPGALLQSPPMKLICFSKRDKVVGVSKALQSLGYYAWDVFSEEWDNGGYLLERRWARARVRYPQVRAIMDDMTSALVFVLTMRGEVHIPQEALEEDTD